MRIQHQPGRAGMLSMSPTGVSVTGVILVLALFALDYYMPARMSFTLLDLLVIAFVGWGAGKRQGIALAVVCTALTFAVEWSETRRLSQEWIIGWNTLTTLLGFGLTAWAVAELSRLVSNRGSLVKESTTELRLEVERHRATAKRLEELVHRFEQVSNNIAEVFWLTNVEKSEMVYISPAYERIWGRSCQELYQHPKSWLESVHQDDRARVEQSAATEQVHGAYDVEYRIVRPGGEIRWVRDRAFPVRDANGAVIRIAGLSDDITERKRMELELRSGEERLRLAMKAARMIAWDLDLNTRELSYPLASDANGTRDRQSLEDRLQTIHADDRPAFLAAVASVSKENSSAEGEYRVLHPDGCYHWVYSKGQVMPGAENKHRRLLGISMDITERKATEERLRASEERYRTLAESSPDTIFILNQQERIDYINTAGAAVWSCRPEELIGKHQASLFPQDQARYHSELLRATFGTGAQPRLDTEVRFPEGAKWFETRLVPVKNAAGSVVAVMGVSRDISDRKAAEQSLAEALDLNQKMLASSTTGISAFNGSGECLFANEALARITGGTVEQLLALDFNRLQAWQSSGFLEMARHTLATGEPSAGELHGFSTFGKRLSLDCRLTRFFSGSVPNLLCMADDITERKRAEFWLMLQRDLAVDLSRTSQLEEGLKRLLEQVIRIEGIDSGGVYLLDRQGGLALAAHLGLSPHFVRRASYYDRERLEVKLVARGQPVYETASSLADTKAQWTGEEGLRSFAVLPLSYEGKLLGALNLASHIQADIPAHTRFILEIIASEVSGAIARIRTEQALHQSEARLRAIIQGAPVILLATDSQGLVVLEEGQPLRLLPLHEGDRVGLPVEKAFAGCPNLVPGFRRALRGEEFSSAVQLGELSFDCHYTPSFSAAGKVSGCICVATNTTERQRLERQLLEISDREQARLGQEIHDGLCQQLVSLAFDANDLRQQVAQFRNAPAATKAERLTECLDEAITVSRQLARGLFPIRLDADGLPPALEELATSTTGRFQIICEFRQHGSIPHLKMLLATHLFRIAQEAVINSVKHSRGQHVHIHLRGTENQIELSIEDDGIGLATPQGGHTGMGLHIMDYRARSLGGALNYSKSKLGGLRVCCCVPICPE